MCYGALMNNVQSNVSVLKQTGADPA